MDVEKLLPLESQAQIISAIERAAHFGGEIWQNGPSGRKILKIYKIYFDGKNEGFVLRTFGLADVDPRLPVFIRLAYRNVLFKLDTHEYDLGGDRLVCGWPEEARAFQVRGSDRYALPLHSDISLTLKRVERTTSETVMDLEVRIVDVSERGFGILISAGNRDFLQRLDHFWIKAIDHRPLRPQIFGTVVYVAAKGIQVKRGDVRVGLSLDAPLSEELFENLKKKSNIVLAA